MTEAPRWRLQGAHYINVHTLLDGTRVEWEHKETARESGRTVRKLFSVPMYLDPRDASDCNYPGEIIVAHDIPGTTGNSRDYIFTDEPTPDMEPLNDAARVITDALSTKWNHPIESLPVNGGMNEAESRFMQKMMETFAPATPAAQATSVPKAQYDELAERLAKLEAAVSDNTPTADVAHPNRRV